MLKFFQALLSCFCGQRLDRILHYGYSSLALQKAFDCVGHAEFRYYSEDYEFWIGTQTLHQFIRVQRLKDVERLFFQDDLLVGLEIGW